MLVENFVWIFPVSAGFLSHRSNPCVIPDEKKVGIQKLEDVDYVKMFSLNIYSSFASFVVTVVVVVVVVVVPRVW